MVEVSQCVICDGAIRQVKRALVAPFLARRIWNRNPFCVDLVQCQGCGFMFYNPRLDESDLRSLYAGYRSEEYQRMRHSFEPWYTVAFNNNLASPKSYETRRAKLAPILREHIGKRTIRRVLDYGGDRGDLVVGLVEGAEMFVYEISGVSAAAGVTATTDPIGCRADLTINSNVLEHVGFPRDLVSEILGAAPDGGLVYLEVPCESPLGFARVFRRLAQIGVVSLARPKIAPSMMRPASFYMMHEHINYFTEQNLAVLVQSCGGTVIASGSYQTSGRPGDAALGWCLATK